MATNFLSDAYIKNLQYAGQRKIADGGGLYIFLTPNGSKLWRMKYRFDGKEKTLSFGPYPLVSLSEAREKRDAAKKLLLQKIDPSEKKKCTAPVFWSKIKVSLFVSYIPKTRL